MSAQDRNDEMDQEGLWRFEQADLALKQAKRALLVAQEQLEHLVPEGLCEKLIPLLQDIEGLARSVFPHEDAKPLVLGKYREGLLCCINGVGYWHSGRQYGVLVGSPDGPDQDLRELPGFKRIEDRFGDFKSLLYGSEWRDVGEAAPEVKAALDLLRAWNERLWWSAVADFLRTYKDQRVDREVARRVLLDSGFDAVKVAALLPD